MDIDANYSDFISYYNDEDYVRANLSLVRELGRVLAEKRGDFIDLLNESDIYANNEMSDERLVDLFFDNIGSNKRLQLGASLLVSINNKEKNFDGTDEVNDDAVKAGYHVLNEQHSGLVPGLVGAGLRFGAQVLRNRQDQQKAVVEHKQKSVDSKKAMQAELQKQKALKAQAEAKKQAKLKADETKKTYLIIGGFAALGIIAAIIAVKFKK